MPGQLKAKPVCDSWLFSGAWWGRLYKEAAGSNPLLCKHDSYVADIFPGIRLSKFVDLGLFVGSIEVTCELI
jgi:hypothetical protein